MKKILLSAALVVLFSTTVWAADLDPTELIALGGERQSAFKDMSKEIGFGLSYFPLAPAEPLGITGFNIGVQVNALDIEENEPYWEAMGDFPGLLPIPRIHAQKGLPFGIDIGAVYSKVPDTNIQLVGGEIKWAVLEGSVATPAVALRGSYTKLMGVDNLDLQTYGYDASISKGFAMVTPYAGVGQVIIDSEPKNVDNLLDDEKITETKYFVGIKTSLLVFNITAEAAFAEVPVYSLGIGIGF